MLHMLWRGQEFSPEKIRSLEVSYDLIIAQGIWGGLDSIGEGVWGLISEGLHLVS